MIEMLGDWFYNEREAAVLLGVNPRMLQGHFRNTSTKKPRRPIPLHPITMLTGRRLYKKEEVNALVEKTFRIKIDDAMVKETLKELEAEH
jgi:hypothetical protein